MAGKFPGHKVALLSVDGQKVTYTKRDLAVGLWPYNLDVTPDGRLALTADNGNAGGSDGNVDTVSVIDLEAKPERVIDKVVVGDAPEGFAISPNGKLAVAVLLRGSNNAKTEFFYNRNGSVVRARRSTARRSPRSARSRCAACPRAPCSAPTAAGCTWATTWTRDLSVLRVDGDTVTNTGTLVKLPGKPASMRGRTQ